MGDLPPAKYNPGASVKNSLIASGSIVNGTVENSVLFKKVFVGNNCVIKNSIILNEVYLGDNTYIENCIIESRNTIRANTKYVGEDGIKLVIENEETGDYYEGFVNEENQPHGFGKMLYASGDMYEGYFENGIKQGTGTMTFNTACIYIGEWNEDQKGSG